VLKEALARHVPRDLVFRPKSGFVLPLREAFRQPRFIAAFDRLRQREGPLAGLLDHAWVDAAREALVHGGQLPAQTYSFIWAAVFTNLWLQQWAEQRTAQPGGITA
jgi:hypothetical protein